MSDLLKSVIQDLINDRSEQAQVTIHDYIVSKTQEIAGLTVTEEKWSGDVKTKVHPPEDLFATGSAADIAAWAKRSHPDLQGAMAALNFYVNRAGKNLSASQKSKVEAAKKLLQD